MGRQWITITETPIADDLAPDHGLGRRLRAQTKAEKHKGRKARKQAREMKRYAAHSGLPKMEAKR